MNRAGTKGRIVWVGLAIVMAGFLGLPDAGSAGELPRSAGRDDGAHELAYLGAGRDGLLPSVDVRSAPVVSVVVAEPTAIAPVAAPASLQTNESELLASRVRSASAARKWGKIGLISGIVVGGVYGAVWCGRECEGDRRAPEVQGFILGGGSLGLAAGFTGYLLGALLGN